MKVLHDTSDRAQHYREFDFSDLNLTNKAGRT